MIKKTEDFDYNLLTSNLKMAAEPPKIEDAKCSHNRMLRPEESRPPRYRYSLRLANMAANEKQLNASAVPTKALTKILEVGGTNISCISMSYFNITSKVRMCVHVRVRERERER